MPSAATLDLGQHPQRGRGLLASLRSLWRALMRPLTPRSRRHPIHSSRSNCLTGVLPTYLPALPDSPPSSVPPAAATDWLRQAVAPEHGGTPRLTQLQSLELALRLGRGFGTIRSSVLLAAAEQLRIEALAGTPSPEIARLQQIIARELLRREARRANATENTLR